MIKFKISEKVYVRRTQLTPTRIALTKLNAMEIPLVGISIMNIK